MDVSNDDNDVGSNNCGGGNPPPAGRYEHLRKVLERRGPFTHADFEAGPDILQFMRETARILIVGAGGLGCELVKNIALMGFRNIHIIDMDTIDLSNLNRQFLFRVSDVGKPKADVAAECINRRIQGVQVTPHYCKIQDKEESFYKSFHIVVCGLDSIVARRWLNGMILSLVEYDDDGVKEQTIIPIVDGGSEGFKGNARVIIPTMNPCIDCTLDLYPPQVNYPLCTLANKPRLPEHCIEYVRVMLWNKENPFEVAIDGDDPNHINWIYEKALERANQFQITGVTYRLTQGVVKHIIPAVASTNAVIAAACATEVFKIASSCCNPMQNYMVFNDVDGIYTYTYEAEKKEDCLACSNTVKKLSFKMDTTLQNVIDFLKEDGDYRMKNPGVAANIGGKHKNLFLSILPSTKNNLKKSLKELNIMSGTELTVSDETRPTTVAIEINLTNDVSVTDGPK